MKDTDNYQVVLMDHPVLITPDKTVLFCKGQDSTQTSESLMQLYKNSVYYFAFGGPIDHLTFSSVQHIQTSMRCAHIQDTLYF